MTDAPLRIMALHDIGPGCAPHLACIYQAMRSRGAVVVQGHVAGGWALRHLRGVDVVHLHWPSFHYASAGRGRTLYRAALLLFVLGLARLRGAVVVWTVHNLMPHERSRVPGLDRAMRHAIVALSARFLVHGAAAEAAAVRAFPAMRGRVAAIPFGTLAGLYPDEVTRAAARAELGIAAGERVVLLIGHLRRYKNVVGLIGAMAETPEGTVLVVAGAVREAALESEIRAAAAGCPRRMVLRFGHVPDKAMQVYLRAADVVAAPYATILTSASTRLASAFGRPFVGPAMGALVGTVTAEMGVLYERPEGLGAALREALGRRFDEDAIRAEARLSTWDASAEQALAAMGAARAAMDKRAGMG